MSHIQRRADQRQLFTNAIPLLFDTGGLICCLSALDRFPPPQTTWLPGTPPEQRILMPILVRTSDRHSTARARTPDRIQSYNSSLQVAGLQECAATPSDSSLLNQFFFIIFYLIYQNKLDMRNYSFKTSFFNKKKEDINKHWWFSGRMLACHAGGPGSIPGQCIYFCFN